MFVGHYFAAPLAAATGKIKLWHGFVAVQFVDFIWAGLNLAGIETTRIADDAVQTADMTLVYLPYSHSLVFTLFWAAIAAILFKVLTGAKDYSGAMLIGFLVLSHWFTDVLAHGPDLPLYPGGLKLGFGLGNNMWLGFLVELILTLGAVWIYVSLTSPTKRLSRLWTFLFFVFLAGVQIYYVLAPTPTDVTLIMVSALISFTLIALIAGLYERTRETYMPVDDSDYVQG